MQLTVDCFAYGLQCLLKVCHFFSSFHSPSKVFCQYVSTSYMFCPKIKQPNFDKDYMWHPILSWDILGQRQAQRSEHTRIRTSKRNDPSKHVWDFKSERSRTIHSKHVWGFESKKVTALARRTIIPTGRASLALCQEMSTSSQISHKDIFSTSTKQRETKRPWHADYPHHATAEKELHYHRKRTASQWWEAAYQVQFSPVPFPFLCTCR